MNIQELTDAEWLAAHRSGEYVTGSMAATICGANPYQSEYALFHMIKGAIPWPEETRRMRVGKRLETLILEEYAAETERSVFAWEQRKVVIHDTLPWLICTPDATQRRQDQTVNEMPGLLEIKTGDVFSASARNWKEGQIPLAHQVQIQVQLACTGLTWGTMCGMIGTGGDLFYQDVEPNADFIAAMIAACERFLERLRTNDSPAPDGSDSSTDAIRALYRRDDGPCVELPIEAVEKDARLRELKAELKARETEKVGIENWLKDQIGDNEAGECGDMRYTYKSQTRQNISDKGREHLLFLNDPEMFEAVKYKVLRRAK